MMAIKPIACDFLRLDPSQNRLNGMGGALSMSQLVSKGETAVPRQPRLRAVPHLVVAALRWS
jgi:hypothetical protein